VLCCCDLDFLEFGLQFSCCLVFFDIGLQFCLLVVNVYPSLVLMNVGVISIR
jgi:hypothetical protein